MSDRSDAAVGPGPTRLLDRFGPDLAALRGHDLRRAITASEGRVVLAEIVASARPLLRGTANAELAAAFGADLLCCNLVDPLDGDVLLYGFDELVPAPRGFRGLRAVLGRPVGLNLEPAADPVPPAHRATGDRVAAAADGGASFVVVTANPGRHVTLDLLADAVGTVRSVAPDMVCLAGKMHHTGTREPLDERTVTTLLDSGAHGVLIPLPGTVPGVSEATAAAMVDAAHAGGALAIGTIGTSQEGADPATIRHLALTAKRIGVDVHHIGDAGLEGVAAPENIYHYSVAIRGVRHTWNRMARNSRATWGDQR